MGIISSASRFILLDRPSVTPGVDLVNKTPDGPVFDLGIDLENYSGVAYIKAEHVEEMGRVLEMVPLRELLEAQAEIADLKRKIEHSSETRLADAVIAVVDGFRNSPISVGTDVNVDSLFIEGIEETTPDAPNSSDSGEGESETGENEPSEHSEGSNPVTFFGNLGLDPQPKSSKRSADKSA